MTPAAQNPHTPNDISRQEVHETVMKWLQKHVPTSERARAQIYIHEFLKDAPLDDLAWLKGDRLLHVCLSMWVMNQRHKRGNITIRVYNPQLKTHGWDAPVTVIEMINDDKPFLVDSITNALTNAGLHIVSLLHPMYQVVRNAQGVCEQLSPVTHPLPRSQAESHIQVIVEPQLSSDELKQTKNKLTTVLEQVNAAVSDWKLMRAHAADVVRQLTESPPQAALREEVDEAKAFLGWMIDNKFTFLGYRDYQYVRRGSMIEQKLVGGSGLGIARDPKRQFFTRLLDPKQLSRELQYFIKQPHLIMITKSTVKSPVHRDVPLDCVIMKQFDAKGRVVGEQRFLGLFTSTAYTRSASEIPILRRKINLAFQRSHYLPGTHNGKAMVHVLENYPRDELFQISDDDLLHIAKGIVHMRERQKIALFVREDNFGRFVSCFIYAPRDRFDSQLKRKFFAILEHAFNATVFSTYTEVSDAPLARTHVVLSLNVALPAYDISAITHKLIQAAQRFNDALRSSIQHAVEQKKISTAALAWSDSFPLSYQEQCHVESALDDLPPLMRAHDTRQTQVRLSVENNQLLLRLYRTEQPFVLSDILPTLENFGWRVISEHPFQLIAPNSHARLSIQLIELAPKNNSSVATMTGETLNRLAQMIDWALQRHIADDGYNSLADSAQLNVRDIQLLRTLAAYVQQLGLVTHASNYIQAFAQYPHVAKQIVQTFNARFNPQLAPKKPLASTDIVASFEPLLASIAHAETDRIFRHMIDALAAIVRTNFYQLNSTGEAKNYLAIKFLSHLIPGIPKPVPMAEIFVHAPHMSGIHLRGGKVARGGLRWSDRMDDFRTEILSLMRAQMVKNAVIVPVGAKGGFVVYGEPTREHVTAAYQTLVRGLLDVTDNIINNKIVPPANVVRIDGDDPYLVVAADKGTAGFSDVANALAQEYQFWLGDAFASGGSNGYNHKDMAITARGAFECIKRHFRERDVDLTHENISVVGVGDMSGDVFGNGMLLSKHFKLLAAFDHRHIFVDPQPDAAASFKERQRLFSLPKSSWADYNPKLISEGGGVFDRTAKRLDLSPQVQSLLSLPARVTPQQLMRAILSAPADLLWFGGIGTFIKHPDEDHGAARDRTNDAIRINSDEVRAKVIGEGANLGMTQRARIDYALRGGRVNTDFIDNSGGVDCSDHEVNIKILLNAAVRDKRISRTARDQLLKTMTDDVAQLVLRDNFQQSQILSLDQQLSIVRPHEYLRLIKFLAKRQLLDARFELLPDEDTIADRHNDGHGLTRPELAVLLAYTKNQIAGDLLASNLPDKPEHIAILHRYFPTTLVKQFAKSMPQHRLRRELIARQLTNDLLHHVSLPFVCDMMEKTNASVATIVQHYLAIAQLFDLDTLWQQLESLDAHVTMSVVYPLMMALQDFTEDAIYWLLRYPTSESLISPAALKHAQSIRRTLHQSPQQFFSTERLHVASQYGAELVSKGVPETLARRMAMLDFKRQLLPLHALTFGDHHQLVDVAWLHRMVGQRLSIDVLQQLIKQIPLKTSWHHQARASFEWQLGAVQRDCTQHILSLTRKQKPQAVWNTWLMQNHVALARLDLTMKDLAAFRLDSFTPISVVVPQLQSIAQTCGI